MTVRLLTDYPPYLAGNLATFDGATETSLIAQHFASADLTGGAAYQAPPAGNPFPKATFLGTFPTPAALSAQAPVGSTANAAGSAYEKTAEGWIRVAGAARTGLGLKRQQDRATVKTNGALIQAPAWALSTVYAVGDTVRLTSGPLIICQTAGTSGVTSPPFSSEALITDNTVTWCYMGRLSKQANSNIEAPVITTSATIPTGATALRFNSGTNNVVTPNLPVLLTPGTSFVGQSNVLVVQDTFYNNGTTQQINSQPAGQVSISQGFEFITDDPSPGIGTWNNANDVHFDLYVGDPDGSNMYLVEEMPTKIIAGNPCWYIVNWGNGSGRKLRRYRVETRVAGAGSFSNFYGLALLANSRRYAPQQDGLRGLIIMDSYATTTSPGFSVNNPMTHKIAARTLKHLGVRHWQAIQQAGAGYSAFGAAAGGTNVFGATAQPVSLPVMFANNPGLASTQFDVVLFCPGLNDTPYTATQQAAVLSSLQSARANWPNAFIMVFGLQNGLNNSSTPALATDAAIQAAWAQWGDANSAFQSTLTGDGQAWVSGTGHLGATTGVGNTDYMVGIDSVHAPQWATEILAISYAADTDRAMTAAGF